MGRFWLIWAGIHGFLSVAFGAFGAHALKNRLDPEMLKVFETGARYEMFAALALLGVAALARPGEDQLKAVGWCLALGALLFSGSLYTLALTGQPAFGAVTPLGGLLLMAGWALIAWEGVRTYIQKPSC